MERSGRGIGFHFLIFELDSSQGGMNDELAGDGLNKPLPLIVGGPLRINENLKNGWSFNPDCKKEQSSKYLKAQRQT